MADVTGQCTATAVAPTTTDACVGTITGTTSDPLTYNTQGTFVIHWTFNDGNGNSIIVNQNVNVTVPESGPPVLGEACNTSTDTVDLNTLLPAGTSSNGIWIDVNNSGHLQGSILSPLDMSPGDYVYEYKVTNGVCPLSIKINMNVDPKYCEVAGVVCDAIEVHKALTPNGDGKNDILIIEGVDSSTCYPSGVSVEIYNRWGILVFETSKYSNTSNYFDGYSRGRTTVSKSDGLPTGTYFYIVNYESVDNGNIQMNRKDGFIYLSR